MRALLLVIMALLSGAAPALSAPRVIASIRPVEALVAGVMANVGTPQLLVPAGESPHDYALKPSQAASLEEADLVFWIGPAMEHFLVKPIDTIASGARSVPLMTADGVVTMPFRAGGLFEADDDGDHDDGADPHVWLDPRNARAMVKAIAAALVAADPDNAATYRANAETLDGRLVALEGELAALLAPVAGRPFIVFHDAYHYFEARFGVTAAGSITVNPELAPGAERLAAIRERIAGAGALCVFTEPQFPPRIVAILIDGTGARTGVLDAEGGFDLPDGPDLYFGLMRELAGNLAGCLAGG